MSESYRNPKSQCPKKQPDPAPSKYPALDSYGPYLVEYKLRVVGGYWGPSKYPALDSYGPYLVEYKLRVVGGYWGQSRKGAIKAVGKTSIKAVAWAHQAAKTNKKKNNV